MGWRGLAVMVGFVVASFVAGLALFSGRGDGVKRPAFVPAKAAYVDGLVAQIGSDRVVIQRSGGQEVELVITLRRAGQVDIPHLVNFHEARNEPVRVYYERRHGQLLAVGDVDLPSGPQPPNRGF
jgi:hypothetical protein